MKCVWIQRSTCYFTINPALVMHIGQQEWTIDAACLDYKNNTVQLSVLRTPRCSAFVITPPHQPCAMIQAEQVLKFPQPWTMQESQCPNPSPSPSQFVPWSKSMWLSDRPVGRSISTEWATSLMTYTAFLASTSITHLQFHGWRPAKLLPDQRIVRVSASDTFWSRNVLDRQILALNAHHCVCHVIHGYHLITSNVKRLPEVRLGQTASN